MFISDDKPLGGDCKVEIDRGGSYVIEGCKYWFSNDNSQPSISGTDGVTNPVLSLYCNFVNPDSTGDVTLTNIKFYYKQ